MEDPNNYDTDEDAFDAGFVAGGGFVAAGDGDAAVTNNKQAVGAAAGANEEDDDDDDDDDEDDDDDDDDDDDNDDDDNDNDDNDNDEDDRMAIQKLFSVLQQREDFPLRQRNKIIELAHQFVNNLGADIKDMVTDQRTLADGYAGLVFNRDTKQEVETALRHYPETLSERGGVEDLFPIHCITLIVDRAHTHTRVCNLLAVSFVVLFAKLAIELNLFADEERGGLLARSRGDGGCNTLTSLVQSSHRSYDEDYHQHADTRFLEVLVQLRRSGLFNKEDIQQYQLVHEVCNERGYFAEKRFQFLTNWDPSSLLQLGDHGELPLHCTFRRQTFRQFQVIIDCYFQYFTKEQVICFLFQKDNHGKTPFLRACVYLHKHKTDTLVHDAIEQSLGTARFSSPTSSSSSSSLNIGTMLMMATRIDNIISLDGWYYFIRRQPDTMLSMLRHRRWCDDISSPILSSSPSSLSNNNNNTGTNGRITGISHSSIDNNTNTRINDDSASIDRTNTNTTINDDDATFHNNNNNNDDVVVRRRTVRKRKQRS